MRVTIGEEEKVADIGAALEKAGVIKSKYAFLIQCIFYDYGGTDHPVEEGTYLLNNSYDFQGNHFDSTGRDNK